MAKLNDLDDVTISNPKAGEVVKYTATGWVNAADSTSTSSGGKPCGTNGTQDDEAETITEPWTWKVADGECGITVEHQDGVNDLDQYAKVCPSRIVVGNKNGRMQLKTFDGGGSRITAFDDQLSFYDVNNPDGVTLTELVACCDDGGEDVKPDKVFDPIVVNFPNPGVCTYQHSGRATTVDLDGTGDPQWSDEALNDVFGKEFNLQRVPMPRGSNAAVMFMTYEAAIRPWHGVKSSGTGYANVSINYQMNDNKGGFTVGPGPLAAGIRLYGDILGWDDGASNIAQGEDEKVRQQRTPSHSASAQRIVRTFFPQSTGQNATVITIKPYGIIHRIRGCELSMGTGRILIIPYKDDGNGWLPENGSNPFGLDLDTDYEEFDDGAVEKAFDEAMESRELKQRMNYMSNAIRETLDYDQNLDPNGIPILEQALKDIFGLKQEQIDDYDYYENRLNTIKELVLPYVGFQFGFEQNNTRISF